MLNINTLNEQVEEKILTFSTFLEFSCEKIVKNPKSSNAIKKKIQNIQLEHNLIIKNISEELLLLNQIYTKQIKNNNITSYYETNSDYKKMLLDKQNKVKEQQLINELFKKSSVLEKQLHKISAERATLENRFVFKVGLAVFEDADTLKKLEKQEIKKNTLLNQYYIKVKEIQKKMVIIM